MNIVFASHTHMGSAFVVGSHHLAKSMVRDGHRVVHISAPLTPFHLANWGDLNTRTRLDCWKSGGVERHKVLDYVPMTVLPWPALTKLGLPYHWYSCCFPSIRSRVKFFGMDDVDLLLMDEPRFVGLNRLLKPKQFIYRATDMYALMRQDETINQAERLISADADFMCGTSLPVVSHLQSISGKADVHLFENGVDVELFSKKYDCPEDLKKIGQPRAVYTGAFDDRFDFSAVCDVASSHPTLNIVLIGPCSEDERKRFSGWGNIYLLGAKPFEEIPAYLQHCDIALLPLSDHPANNGRSPMKLYEYGICGLPVVAKYTEELARRAEKFVFLYRDNHELVERLRGLLAMDSRELSNLREAARLAAQNNGWEGISRRTLALCGM